MQGLQCLHEISSPNQCEVILFIELEMDMDMRSSKCFMYEKYESGSCCEEGNEEHAKYNVHG